MKNSAKTLYRWLVGTGIMMALYGTAVMILTHSKGFSFVDPKSINYLLFSWLAVGIIAVMRLTARSWLNGETRRSPLTSIVQILVLGIIGAGCLTAAIWVAAGRPDVQIQSR